MSSASSGSLRVGLTGGLACGKSTVLEVFAARGAGTIDADQIARTLLSPGSPLVPRVVELLGDHVQLADGSLDRSRVAGAVFADAAKRRALEGLIHPEVIRIEEARAAELEAQGKQIIIADIPLLFEAGQEHRFARLVVVRCDVEQQVARAIARGMDETDARQRIAAQMPLADKAARADYVIDSEGSIAETRERAAEVFEALEREAISGLEPGRPSPSGAPLP